ncbi:MAG: GNAT family N-acetyltransferase [Roseovarius sp.]
MSTPSAIPVLTTEHLTLRGYRETDFYPFAAFAASERSRFVGGPQTRDEAWRSFMAAIGHWALRGYGMWVVEHRESQKVVGRVGVILNDGWHEPELGWHIYDGFEGKGYAYEACVAARRYAAEHYDITPLMSYIDPANTRSIRLAERLGCHFERDVEVRGKPCQLWRHPGVEGMA